MRKILFKAKRIDNGEWMCGYLWRGVDHSYMIPSHVGIGYSEERHFMEAYAHEIDSATICQYTGMNDKNGVRIWEHSKCSVGRLCVYAVGHIKYLSGCFCFVEDGTKYILRLCDIKSNGYEIKVESDNPEPMEG